MKLFAALLLFLLPTGRLPADTTLIFDAIKPEGSAKVTYYIKDGMLRYTEEGNPRINLYDSSKQLFVSIDQGSGTISRIDKDIIARTVEHKNKLRLQKLLEVEKELNKKIHSMSEQEQEATATLVNQLKYPEFYGAHTMLKTGSTGEKRAVTGIDCTVYDVRRAEALLKQLCMAPAASLKMNEDDYRTLRKFFRFNYMAQTQLMIASGKTNFTYVDYEQENIPGIALEIRELTEGRSLQPKMVFKSISGKKLDSSLFEAQTPKK